MSRPRSYRPDRRCPHCNSSWVVKFGRDNGKQTYRCRECHHRFTPDGKRHFYPEAVKQQAVALYSEGKGVTAISRELNIKAGTIYPWLKRAR